MIDYFDFYNSVMCQYVVKNYASGYQCCDLILKLTYDNGSHKLCKVFKLHDDYIILHNEKQIQITDDVISFDWIIDDQILIQENV